MESCVSGNRTQLCLGLMVDSFFQFLTCSFLNVCRSIEDAALDLI